MIGRWRFHLSDHSIDLFTAATVLLAIEYEGQGVKENDATERAFEQSLIILREMQGRSSMASSYVAMLKKAKEAQEAGQNGPVFPATATAPSPRSSNTAARNYPATSDLGPNGTNGINLEEYLKDDARPADAPFPAWNMQDLFLVPWDMTMVDNPMPSFWS